MNSLQEVIQEKVNIFQKTKIILLKYIIVRPYFHMPYDGGVEIKTISGVEYSMIRVKQDVFPDIIIYGCLKIENDITLFDENMNELFTTTINDIIHEIKNQIRFKRLNNILNEE